jgi:hypothetical protein
MSEPSEEEFDDWNEAVQYALRNHSARMESGKLMEINKETADLFVDDLNYFLSK